ncbi:UPF0489 protein C5orf22 homolog [Clytia hemisphaerica]
MASLSKRKSIEKAGKLQIVVCEYHQDVIQFIHRFVARKKLPFKGIKMIHLDSHPDLAYPDHLLADDCFHKGTLYDQLDIADWILPLMYQGHLQDLIWVRPPWAEQIDDLETPFKIGKHRGDGKLKVTCTGDYFLEDGIYSPEEALQNIQDVNLKVTLVQNLTVDLIAWRDDSNQQHISPSPQKKLKSLGNDDDIAKNDREEKRAKLIISSEEAPRETVSIKSEVDKMKNSNPLGNKEGSKDVIELTDVSVKCNAEDESITSFHNNQDAHTTKYLTESSDAKLKDKFSNEEDCLVTEEHLKNRFFPSPDDRFILDIDLDYFSVTNPFLQDYTEEEYKELKNIYHIDLPTNKEDQNELAQFVEKSTKKLQSLKRTIQQFATGKPPKEIQGNKELVDFLVRLKTRKPNINEEDWDLVHNAGMTTELPHHISNDTEIDQMLAELKELIQTLPHPTLITVARSAIDEYCPPDQVDQIEKKVIDLLTSYYHSVDVLYDYKDKTRLI